VHGIAQTLPRLSADKSEEYSRIKIELIKYILPFLKISITAVLRSQFVNI